MTTLFSDHFNIFFCLHCSTWNFQFIWWYIQIYRKIYEKQEEYRWAYKYRWGFHDGSDGKESACNAGDLGSIPGLGRPPGEGNGYPLHYSGLENFMDCIVHGVAKSWSWLSDSLLRMGESGKWVAELLELEYYREIWKQEAVFRVRCLKLWWWRKLPSLTRLPWLCQGNERRSEGRIDPWRRGQGTERLGKADDHRSIHAIG